jgi:hypothetical protein
MRYTLMQLEKILYVFNHTVSYLKFGTDKLVLSLLVRVRVEKCS